VVVVAVPSVSSSVTRAREVRKSEVVMMVAWVGIVWEVVVAEVAKAVGVVVVRGRRRRSERRRDSCAARMRMAEMKVRAKCFFLVCLCLLIFQVYHMEV